MFPRRSERAACIAARDGADQEVVCSGGGEEGSRGWGWWVQVGGGGEMEGVGWKWFEFLPGRTVEQHHSPTPHHKKQQQSGSACFERCPFGYLKTTTTTKTTLQQTLRDHTDLQGGAFSLHTHHHLTSPHTQKHVITTGCEPQGHHADVGWGVFAFGVVSGGLGNGFGSGMEGWVG